jgi:hypothetical protein
MYIIVRHLSAGRASRQMSYKSKKYHLLHIHMVPADDGLQMGPKTCTGVVTQ